MNGNHKIRTLGFYTCFDSESVAMDCQKVLTVFAGERLPRIMEDVFNNRSRPGFIRRFGRVEFDLGAISEDEFPDGIEDRLRQKLEDFFDQHPLLTEPVWSMSSSQQLTSGQAEEEAIFYFLKNGVLPWHGPFSNADEITTYLGARLEAGAASFINRLKELPDIKTMVTRLVRQFSEDTIEKILEAAIPGRGRSTREVIQRLEGFYAVGAGGQDRKDPGSSVDTLREIKDHVWEHVLLITLGKSGIFPVLLKQVFTRHFSFETRQEIFRTLNGLPGSIDMVWGEVILHCFDALKDDNLLPPETALKYSPGPVSLPRENTEEERKSHQTLTDSFWGNCQDDQARGDQIHRPAKGNFSRISPGKKKLNGDDESDNGVGTKTTTHNLDTATDKDMTVLGNTVQKNGAVEKADPFRSGVRSHSLWAGKIYADFRKNDEKIPRWTDPDFSQLQGTQILRAFESLPDKIWGKLEIALKSFPVSETLLGENTGGERESHQTFTGRYFYNHPDKRLPGDQTHRPDNGQVVKESSGKKAANGTDNSDNGDRVEGESRTLRNEIFQDGTDAIITGLSMENFAGLSHGDSQDAFGVDKIQVNRQNSDRTLVGVADPESHRTRQKDILGDSDVLAGGIKGGLETVDKSFWLPASLPPQNTEAKLTFNPIIADSPLENCLDKQIAVDQKGLLDEGESVKEGENFANASDDGARIETEIPISRNEFIKGSADAVMTGTPMENLAGRRCDDFRDLDLDSEFWDKTWSSTIIKKDGSTENLVPFQSGVGSPFGKPGKIIDDLYLQWIHRLLSCLGAMVDQEASDSLRGEALAVLGGMIFGAAVSTPNPEVFLAELSSMVFRLMSEEEASSKKASRVSIEKLTEQLLNGRDGTDDPGSVFNRSVAGKPLETFRPGILWPGILSNAWRWILMSGLVPDFRESDCNSDKSATYLSVMDSVLSLPPEKREPFSIQVLFKFAERMQLPVMPFSNRLATGASKTGKTFAQILETDGDSGAVLAGSLNSGAGDQSLLDPEQKNGKALSDSNPLVSISFEELSDLFQSPVVQHNIKSILNLEEIWDVIQTIIHQKVREKGFETVLEKFKSDACNPQQNPSDHRQEQDLDSLADKLSLILKNGPDPKDFLVRMLSELVSGDSHKEHGPGEHLESSGTDHKNWGKPPAEKKLGRAGADLPTWHPVEEPHGVGAETPSAVTSREWGRNTEPVFVENAGMVLAGPYFSMLFKKLDLLDNKAFKSHYAAETAVHVLEYMVTGEQSAPEYRLVLNKLLCGLEPNRPTHKLFLLEKAQTDVTRELILSMIAHWKVLGKTSVEGFRQSFLTREGRLEATEEAWNLVVAPKPFDMLLDRIPWTFSPIRLAWMDRPLYVHWR